MGKSSLIKEKKKSIKSINLILLVVQNVPYQNTLLWEKRTKTLEYFNN